MKLQLICFLVFSSLVLSSSVCIRNVPKKGAKDSPVWFCIRSKDYVADIARAPKDVKTVAFLYSDIPKLKADSLTPLANTLERLTIINCNLEDMEDNALKGLTSLRDIIISGNKLRTLKASWFRDTTNLRKMEVRGNLIRTIDEELAPLLKNLEILDITENEMRCLSIEFLNQLTNLKTIIWELNPWHMRCFREMMIWIKNKGLMLNDNIDAAVEGLTFTAIKTCVNELTKEGKVDDKEIDKCTLAALDKMMEEKKIDMTE